MATSGSTGYTLTAGQIIDKAFSKIGVKTSEQALQAEEFQDGIDALNMMIKAWGARGLHLWTKEEAVIFLDVGKTDYLLGPTGDKACDLDELISTTTTAAHVAGNTAITIADTAGLAQFDFIGFEMDDGTRFWTTVFNVDSPTQVTVYDGLPSNSKSGSTVFSYTNIIQRPNRVLSTRRKTFGQDNEIPVLKWSRQQYFDQVNKSSKGTVINYYYSPQLDNGRFYIWQTANSVNDFLRITYERVIEDLLTTDDNLDMPNEWLEAVVYNLADRLADDYDAPPVKLQRVTARAQQSFDDLLGWDMEDTSLLLQPEFN